MTNPRRSKRSRKSDEAGQAIVFVALAMSLVLLGAVAFSVDMGNLWFHRQTAQSVADASCTAAAMDMLFTATGGGAKGGFTPGTNFSCSGSPTAAPCAYAAKNMAYAPSKLTAGTSGYDVAFSFPTTVAGLPNCTTGKGAPAICNDPTALSNAFVQVNVDDRVQLYFAGLLSGSRTTDVGAQATCGVVDANSPIPMLILNPTLPNTLNVSGNGNQPKITIAGGPQRSIQVDSNNANAFSSNGKPTVDLSQGGPNLSGSDIGVTAPESLGTSGITYNPGQTGQWLDPTSRISDPFATLPVPPKPGNGTKTTGIAGGTKGCPAGSTCTEYSAGYYAGIQVKNAAAIFDPGVYYLDGDFVANANSCLRPSTAVGDGSGGTIFYFNTGTLNVSADSGSPKPNGCTASVSTTVPNGTGQLQFGVKCTAASEIPANLPATLTGNLLMGPCTGPYGDPLLTADPIGEQHGVLFFGNRSANLLALGDQPAWGGGGAAAALGSMYFHYCNSPDGAGLGSNCPTSAYTDQITLQGNSGSTSYVVGDIVTDELAFGGTPSIVMDLNPNALYYVLKASLLQ
jgi:Putative Flp pilus-assembly TadE/G-like